jgi:hypothetical protein
LAGHHTSVLQDAERTVITAAKVYKRRIIKISNSSQMRYNNHLNLLLKSKRISEHKDAVACDEAAAAAAAATD